MTQTGSRDTQRAYKIILPSRKNLGDLCPAVAEAFVGLVDDSVLLLSPGGLLHLWVKVVVPPFTALLSNPPLEVFGDHRPTLGAILVYQVNNLHKYRQRRYSVSSFSFLFCFMKGCSKALIGFIETTSLYKEGNDIILLLIYSQQRWRQKALSSTTACLTVSVKAEKCSDVIVGSTGCY